MGFKKIVSGPNDLAGLREIGDIQFNCSLATKAREIHERGYTVFRFGVDYQLTGHAQTQFEALRDERDHLKPDPHMPTIRNRSWGEYRVSVADALSRDHLSGGSASGYSLLDVPYFEYHQDAGQGIRGFVRHSERVTSNPLFYTYQRAWALIYLLRIQMDHPTTPIQHFQASTHLLDYSSAPGTRTESRTTSPEGVHQDDDIRGVTIVCVLGRDNISGGETAVYHKSGSTISEQGKVDLQVGDFLMVMEPDGHFAQDSDAGAFHGNYDFYHTNPSQPARRTTYLTGFSWPGRFWQADGEPMKMYNAETDAVEEVLETGGAIVRKTDDGKFPKQVARVWSLSK